MNEWDQADFIREYVRKRGLLPAKEPCEIEALSGGVSSEVWRITSPKERWVLKRALGKLKVKVEWFSDVKRIEREQQAMLAVEPLLPKGQVPQIVDRDSSEHVYIMTCAPEGAVPWKELLMQGNFQSETAHKVGSMLQRLQVRSRSLPEEVRQSLVDQQFFRELRIEPFHVFLIQRHPELREPIERLIRDLTVEQAGRCFVHGDYSPKNILITPNGDVILLDFEVGHWGNPVYDAAFCLGHLMLKGFYLHKKDQALALIRSFLDGYGAVPERLLPHLGLMLLARVDGKSPVEYIREEAMKQWIRNLAVPWVRDEHEGQTLQKIAFALGEGGKS